MTKKNSFWRSSLDYLRDTKEFIYVIAGLFFFGAIIGFVFREHFIFFDELIINLIGKIEGMSMLELTWFIFKNNLSVALFTMMLGIFLGIFPIINIMTNGILLGYVYSRTVDVSGYSSIWLLVPHGIFELPAIFISLGLGLRLGFFVFSRNKKKEAIYRIKGSLKSFVVIVLPLLVIAAIVEGLLIFAGR